MAKGVPGHLSVVVPEGIGYSCSIPEDVCGGKSRGPFGPGDKLEALRPVPGDPRFDSVGAFGRLDLPGG
jgi:hypothetical protein